MRARAFAFGVVAMSALVSRAFHVQTGWSGYVRDAGRWIWVTNEVGKTAQRVGEGMNYFENGTVGYYGITWYVEDGQSKKHLVSFSWEDVNDTSRLSIRTGRIEYGTVITIGERVRVPSFGWEYLPYISYLHEHGVFTCRGNPYSVVMNDTPDDLTVNGVRIRAASEVALLFPVTLKMDEIEGVKFYDLESGEEITPMDHASYGQSGEYYFNGAYYLAWTGNIRISSSKGEGSASRHPPAEPLVFGDMKTANGGKILFAEGGAPVYADGTAFATNFSLMTWWDFSEDDWGTGPVAYINGVNVCGSHSTSHKVEYSVSSDGMRVYGGVGYVDFTMSMSPGNGYGGGSCVMRCWDASQASYDACPSEHKAEASAGTGTASFRVRLETLTGAWTVCPL